MKKGDCQTYKELSARIASTDAPSTEDMAFIGRHVDECERCRTVENAIAAMKLEESGGPAVPMDDLRKRRWIDETIDLANRADDKERGRKRVGDSEKRSGGLGLAMKLAVAAMAAVTIGAVLWVALDKSGYREKTADHQPLAKARVAAPAGRLLLSSGEIRAWGSLPEGNDLLGAGSGLAVERGSAVASLFAGNHMFLGGSTSLEIVRLDSEAVEVELSKGTIIVRVDSAGKGPRLSVSTRLGTVSVTGTVFSVTVDYDDVEVRVYRGSVALREKTGAGRSVRKGERASLGEPGVFAMSGEERLAPFDMMRAFDLLTDENQGVVEIQSVPSGADVKLGETNLGRTPVKASLRQGYYKLMLDLEGFSPVNELLNIEAGEDVVRAFELEPDAKGQLAGRAYDSARQLKAPKESAAKTVSADRPDDTPLGLLTRAQSFRKERRWSEAAKAYNKLIASFPGSEEARTSHVSLGAIELDHLGNPSEALRLFDIYLKGTKRGTLAQEASFGRALALKKMGKAAQEREALLGFVADFPEAVQVARAKARLAELERSGDNIGKGIDTTGE